MVWWLNASVAPLLCVSRTMRTHMYMWVPYAIMCGHVDDGDVTVKVCLYVMCVQLNVCNGLLYDVLCDSFEWSVLAMCIV